TPLNAIIGFTEILQNQYFGDLNERQVEYVDGILGATNHLMTLINDILDLATIEAGYLELELAPVDISDALANLLNAFRNRASDSKLGLEFDCPDGIGTIIADEKRLRQAIYNLITNAVQYTPEGGTITVSARRNDDYLAIAVADTGAGIPEEEVGRIFNKFERGDQSSRESGAGLGLALVKSLIELHGGEIHVESQVDKGATIECRLPFSAKQPANNGMLERGTA
ncbi:MAG: HAMP domain-containing sensor histidine kinase, partial [Rhodospirillaceae bacterium]|nr:HAMP domain-containing sensor histidine kinase [Rhodospirillaceae bacterium]